MSSAVPRIGIVRVAACAATIAGPPLATHRQAIYVAFRIAVLDQNVRARRPAQLAEALLEWCPLHARSLGRLPRPQDADAQDLGPRLLRA
jgi:hypothetical protein